MTDIAKKIGQLFELDQEAKSLTKQAEPLKNDIKDFLREAAEKELTVEGLTATLQIQRRNTIDEDKLVAKLKKLKRRDLVKKVEVPDMEKIEKLIYDQELDATLLEDCVIVKLVEVLRVTKAKRKKETDTDE